MYGRIEFDGSMRLCAKLADSKGGTLSVRLCHRPQAAFAKYFMGLGIRGGKTPASHHWIWDENKHQDAVWIGGVNGGVLIRPTAEVEVRPFVNIYFHKGPKNMPDAWVNQGKGCFSLEKDEQTVLYYDSGAFACTQERWFCANIMLSPFKLVDRREHWNTRYYHKNFNQEYTQADVDEAVRVGCTHINLHHGNDTLPFINYPMFDMESIGALADMAHDAGLGFKYYYTVRELTSRLPELFAFRSLREEIFPPSPIAYDELSKQSWQGGVDPFLLETFGNEIIPAWKHTFNYGKYNGMTDPSVITDPQGRICNFHIGGLAWMIKRVGADGLYIDDVGYDKRVLRRIRRLFDKHNPAAKIDFHTWDHFSDFENNVGAGYGHNMLIYMELLPYLDSLWVGEGFDFDAHDADFLLTEASGLPFGLMSEMLESGCNVWRGMLFGMTSRYPYCTQYSGYSPIPVWRMREQFDEAEMIGFWEDEKPVWTDHKEVLCTTYYDCVQGRMLCCLANFADSSVTCHLCGEIKNAHIVIAPYMEDIQQEQKLELGAAVTLDKKSGMMLIAEFDTKTY